MHLDGHLVTSKTEVIDLLSAGRISKKTYKKAIKQLTADAIKARRLAKFGVFTPAPAEPENLEDAWDDPSGVVEKEVYVNPFAEARQQAEQDLAVLWDADYAAWRRRQDENDQTYLAAHPR